MLCQRNAWSVWKEEKRCWATAEWGWGRACGQGRLLNSWVCQVQKKEPLSENTEVWYRWRVTCYLIFLEHGVWGREGWKILLREQGWKQRNLLRHTNKLQRRQWHPTPVLWKIPWTEEPGRLQSMGLRRVGHNWATSLSLFTFMHWRRKWQPTPVFLPGESQGLQRLVGCRLWGRTESDTTEAT